MVAFTDLSKHHRSDAARRLLRSRRASEWRFRALGLLAISIAMAALVTLVWTVVSTASRALYDYEVALDIAFPAGAFETSTMVQDYQRPLIEQGLMSERTIIRGELRNRITAAVQSAINARVGAVGPEQEALASSMISSSAVDTLVDRAVAGELDDGQTVENLPVLLSSEAMLYFKEVYGNFDAGQTAGELSIIREADGTLRLLTSANDFTSVMDGVRDRLRFEARRYALQAANQQNGIDATEATLASDTATPAQKEAARAARDKFVAERDRLMAISTDAEVRSEAANINEPLDGTFPSVIVEVNGGAVKATRIASTRIEAIELRPLESTANAPAGTWVLKSMARPEDERKLKDTQIAWLDSLQERSEIIARPAWEFLTSNDSRQAELAGLWGGIVGSFWTLVVTFVLAFPLGVLAAIYLEEFAPKNWFTSIVEVNINNLAAIPSIVFGLFGLLLLLSGFEIPFFGTTIHIGGWFSQYRSAAFVGGIVLALMTIPTIIIATRAAIRAVPPSIRDAALGLGASKVQTVFHHVLPLAMPGIMTGTIIGMAQALGETAPLIMVGMVGFFAQVATDVTDPTTVLPAQIFFWSDYPEALFEAKTSLAILVLLGFLILMNGIAVIVRRRFERRW